MTTRTECGACSGNGFLENGDGTTRGCSYCGGNEGNGTDRGRDGTGYQS
jgi:hypothetical protein